MQFRNLVIIILIILFQPISGLASAETKDKYEKIYSDCLDRVEGINNAVVHKCSALSSDAAKADINIAYERAYNSILKRSSLDAKKLEEAQKSWLIYRDTHCDLATIYVGMPMLNFCPMKLNKARVAELEELID